MGDLGTHICHHYFYNCTIVHSPYPYMLQIFSSDTKCVYLWLLERIIFIKWRVSRDELLYLTYLFLRGGSKKMKNIYTKRKLKKKPLLWILITLEFIDVFWDTLYLLTRLYTIHLYYTQFMWIHRLMAIYIFCHVLSTNSTLHVT